MLIRDNNDPKIVLWTTLFDTFFISLFELLTLTSKYVVSFQIQYRTISEALDESNEMTTSS